MDKKEISSGSKPPNIETVKRLATEVINLNIYRDWGGKADVSNIPPFFVFREMFPPRTI